MQIQISKRKLTISLRDTLAWHRGSERSPQCIERTENIRIERRVENLTMEKLISLDKEQTPKDSLKLSTICFQRKEAWNKEKEYETEKRRITMWTM